MHLGFPLWEYPPLSPPGCESSFIRAWKTCTLLQWLAERNKRWLWWYILSIALITSLFFFPFLPSRPIVDDGSVSTTAVRHHCDYYCSLSVFYALGSNPEIHSVSGDLRGQIAQRKMIAWTAALFFIRTFLQVGLRLWARNTLPCHIQSINSKYNTTSGLSYP